MSLRRFAILLTLLGLFYYLGTRDGLQTQSKSLFSLPTALRPQSGSTEPRQAIQGETEIVTEESAIIRAIDTALPSVVTIGIAKTTTTPDRIQFNPFDPFSAPQRQPGQQQTIEQNIGSGFAIAANRVVTNKHVVSDSEATYTITTDNGDTYDVQDISRDPLNDVAILTIRETNLTPLALGDSSSLKLGQIVIAIGTPLGEFPNTVTSGIISGLGRGIQAGSPYEGFVERLDNVIQTDAAINPGNSGGPLLNSKGQAVGINTAVSANSQNIGFAIPINVVKEIMENFEASGGKISRPFLGVRYQMIDKQNALLNEVPEGAYIVEVLEGSPAERADIRPGDIITSFDSERIKGGDDSTIPKLIAKHKVGDRVTLSVWRDGNTLDVQVTLIQFE